MMIDQQHYGSLFTEEEVTDLINLTLIIKPECTFYLLGKQANQIFAYTFRKKEDCFLAKFSPGPFGIKQILKLDSQEKPLLILVDLVAKKILTNSCELMLALVENKNIFDKVVISCIFGEENDLSKCIQEYNGYHEEFQKELNGNSPSYLQQTWGFIPSSNIVYTS